MGGFNEILVGRFNRMLQKLLSMKGPASMNELSTTLQAQVAIFHGAEDRYLEGWDRFAIAFPTVGVAGQKSCFRLRNPVGSNIMAVFELISFYNVNGGAAGDQPTLQQQDSAVDLAVVAAPNQSRIDARGRLNPSLILSNNTAGSPEVDLTNKLTGVVSATTFWSPIFFENQEITLLPGVALQLVSNNLNQTIQTSFLWRERLLEDSERA